MAWHIRHEGSFYALTRDGDIVERMSFARALQNDSSLADALSACLRDAPYAAYAWELAPFSARNASRPTRFAIVDSPALAKVVPDPKPFAEQLRRRAPIATFTNLGGDATLIVPHPDVAPKATHLAAFVRSTSDALQQQLWSAVGAAILQRAENPNPFWVSTAGLGVHWVHVRIDERPKYFRTNAFRNANA